MRIAGSAAGLAAAVSMLVHEPRRDEGEMSPRMPNDDVSDAYTQMIRLWSELEDREQAHGLPDSTEPDGGMAWMLHRWASGQRLDLVLKDSEMAAGDFVRRCKQIVDLLGQIGDGPPAGWDHAAEWAERMRGWARRCERLLVLSPDAVRRVPDLLGVEPERVVWAPNGFDPEGFDRRPLGGEQRLALWRRWLVEEPRGWDSSGKPGSVAYRDEDLAPFAHGGPVLLRIETNAGHGGADLVKSGVAESVDQYAFLFDQLGMSAPS